MSRPARKPAPNDAPRPDAAPPIPATARDRLALAARLALVRPNSPVEVSDPAALRTRRMVLRPLAESDQSEFIRVLRHSRTALDRFCPLGSQGPEPESDEQVFRRQLDLSYAAHSTGRAWRRAAFDPDGRLVGSFNLNDIARGLESRAELVFWVSADRTGTGLGLEGVGATLAHAFADMPGGLGLQRVLALIAPDNAPCLRLAHRAGLVRDPGSGGATLVIGGREVPHDVYSAYAPVGPGDGLQRVVEAKPSMNQSLFGTGLLSILRTEATNDPAGDHGG